MISYDEGFKEGEVTFCGSAPHRGVLNRGRDDGNTGASCKNAREHLF